MRLENSVNWRYPRNMVANNEKSDQNQKTIQERIETLERDISDITTQLKHQIWELICKSQYSDKKQ